MAESVRVGALDSRLGKYRGQRSLCGAYDRPLGGIAIPEETARLVTCVAWHGGFAQLSLEFLGNGQA